VREVEATDGQMRERVRRQSSSKSILLESEEGGDNSEQHAAKLEK
jgi:hypothetical protein